MQSWNPPISPTTFSSGTNTSSSSSSPVSTPFTPIFLSVRPTETPSQPRSTMKTLMLSWARESAGPVLAKTQYQSACTTPLIQHFVPVRRQPSPSRSARVRMPITSLPACGSESPNAARCVPVASGVRYFCFCSSRPGDQQRAGGQPGEQQHQRRRVRVLRDLLDRDREPEDPGAGAAVGLGDAQAGEAGLDEQIEEILRVLLATRRSRGPGAATLSWAIRRTVAWSSWSSGDRSKSMSNRAYRRTGDRPGLVGGRCEAPIGSGSRLSPRTRARDTPRRRGSRAGQDDGDEHVRAVDDASVAACGRGGPSRCTVRRRPGPRPARAADASGRPRSGASDPGPCSPRRSPPIDVHGGYVAAGTGLRNRGYGSIHVAGVPLGADVARAYLYWTVDRRRDDPGRIVPERQGRRRPRSPARSSVDRRRHVLELVHALLGSTAPTSPSLVHGNGDYRLSSFRTRRQGRASDPFLGRKHLPIARRRVARRRLQQRHDIR